MNVGSSGGGTPPGIRAALAAERADTVARVAGLEREFSGIVTAAQSANTDDEHDPEGATIAWERQHVVALLDQAREQLAAIDEARARLDAGGYGRCEVCGQPIAPERLAARPTATRCVACASRRRSLRRGDLTGSANRASGPVSGRYYGPHHRAGAQRTGVLRGVVPSGNHSGLVVVSAPAGTGAQPDRGPAGPPLPLFADVGDGGGGARQAAPLR